MKEKREQDEKDRVEEVAPLDYRSIPKEARECFRRPAFAYTELCPDGEMRKS